MCCLRERTVQCRYRLSGLTRRSGVIQMTIRQESHGQQKLHLLMGKPWNLAKRCTFFMLNFLRGSKLQRNMTLIIFNVISLWTASFLITLKCCKVNKHVHLQWLSILTIFHLNYELIAVFFFKKANVTGIAIILTFSKLLYE